MGYDSSFCGVIDIKPPLSQMETRYLMDFNKTIHGRREEGPYYIGSDVLVQRELEPSQPDFWCQWVPQWDGTILEWDEGEKFYHSAEWMKYIVDHFIGGDPLAKKELPFLQPHMCNGIVHVQGEEAEDIWKIVVDHNVVTTCHAVITYHDELAKPVIWGDEVTHDSP